MEYKIKMPLNNFLLVAGMDGISQKYNMIPPQLYMRIIITFKIR